MFKSLGDLAAGAALYEKYSAVPAEMLAMREVVMARKEPRKLLVQPHLHATEEDGGAAAGGAAATGVGYASFPASPEGMLASFVARYPAEDPELLALYEATKHAVTD